MEDIKDVVIPGNGTGQMDMEDIKDVVIIDLNIIRTILASLSSRKDYDTIDSSLRGKLALMRQECVEAINDLQKGDLYGKRE